MQKFKNRGIVFGSLRSNTVSIHVGYGYGMNDGGGLKEVNIDLIPKDCRMPNTYVWVTLHHGSIIKVEKMSIQEMNENLKA